MWGLLYATPAVALVTVFVVYPFGSILYHAFTRWDGIAPAEWVGLHNFRLLLHDPLFLRALRNNAIFALSVPVQIIVPLFVAYAIHRRVPGWRFFRATVFLPAVYATVVIGILAATVLQLDGPLNRALGGGARLLAARVARQREHVDPDHPPRRDLDELRLQRPALPGRHERDRSDARGSRPDRRRQMVARARHVVVPSLRRVMEIVLVVNTITAFAFMFTYIYTITNGGPGYRHVRLGVLHLQPGVHEPEHGLRRRDRRDCSWGSSS